MFTSRSYTSVTLFMTDSMSLTVFETLDPFLWKNSKSASKAIFAMNGFDPATPPSPSLPPPSPPPPFTEPFDSAGSFGSPRVQSGRPSPASSNPQRWSPTGVSAERR